MTFDVPLVMRRQDETNKKAGWEKQSLKKNDAMNHQNSASFARILCFLYCN